MRHAFVDIGDKTMCSRCGNEVKRVDETCPAISDGTMYAAPQPSPEGSGVKRNARVQDRYDELRREGKHGHYETMFRVVREECDRVQSASQSRVAELERALRKTASLDSSRSQIWDDLDAAIKAARTALSWPVTR